MATQDDLASSNPDANVRQDKDLVESAMTRQLSVSLGRRISLDDLNENSHNETVAVDSPQNGEVDVVTVDNSPGEGAPLTGRKILPVSPEMARPAPKHKRASSPARQHSPASASRSPRANWPSPRSSQSSPGRADAPTGNKNRRFEACILNKAKVWLPIELIEQPKIFHEVVSLETWNNVLTDEDRERLSKMLPDFPESDSQEKMETLRRLFAGENFKFGSPVKKLQKDLRAGYLYLEVFKHKRALRQAKYREYKHQQELRCHRMLKEVLISRQELLEAAQFTAPDEPFKVKRPRPMTVQKDLDEIVTKKYRKILKECRIECGELYTSDEDDDVFIAKDKTPTKKRPSAWYEAPSDIVLPRFTPRVQSTFDPKPISLQSGAGPDGSPNGDDVVIPPAAPDSPLQLTEASYMDMIDKHQRTRNAGMDHFELDTSNITLEEVMTRTFSTQNSPIVPSRDFRDKSMQLSQKRKAKIKDKLAKKRKKGRPPKATTPISVMSMESRTSVATTESSGSVSTNQEGPTVSMDVGKDEDVSSVQSSQKSVLYPNFFSFLRDTLKESPDSHMTLAELQARTEAWQGAPVSALNVWFTLMASWSQAVGSMLKFLIGELPSMPIKSPVVEYSDTTHTWGWIGDGRDSDEQLTILFKQWLTAVLEDKPTPPEVERQASPTVPSPIKVRTDYVVRPSTLEEKALFRAQEHERYEQPHKAYTYRMHGYKSVVGPVKGVYGKETSLNKAREHSLLVSDRPPYVTILSLVRDAVARLPNGEGTRAEVCELLKDSKFLADATDNQINTVVSGALDRLHYEKDPCVKYDGNRKLWIYLHRNRTEEEFERLHLEQAVSVKAKRSIQKQPKLMHKAKTVIKDMQLFHQAVRPPSVLSDTSNDSIISVGMGLETPSPSRSPGSSSISPHSFAKSPASSTTQSPIAGILAGKTGKRGSKVGATAQPQVLQRHLSSPAAISGSQALSPQVQALLTHAAMPSVLVPTSAASSEAGPYQSGNSLIKAQLLAPRGFVAQLTSQQLSTSVPKSSQAVRTITTATQMSAVPVPPLMVGQLLSHPDQAQHQSTEIPGRTGDMVSSTKPGLVPSTNQPITLTLTGANTVSDKSKTQPSSTIPAALAFHSKPGTLPVNVTLTLKGATEEKKAATGGGTSRGHGGKTKLPTVGGLLAGLGMPLEGVSTSRVGRKSSSKAKSPPRASVSKAAASQSSIQSPVSRKKSQPKAEAPAIDKVLTLQAVTSATLVPPQKPPLLASPMIVGSVAAGVHQPSASGLIFQPQVAATAKPSSTNSSKTATLTVTQASAIRTLTSLASQQTLQDKPHLDRSNIATSQQTHSEIPSIPMSLFMASSGPQGATMGQGVKSVSVVGSLHQGAIPLITNPLLSTGIPASLTPGKGVILQVPIGSKRVSAIPAAISKQKCTAPVILTSSTLTSSLMTPVVTQESTNASRDQTEPSTKKSEEVSTNQVAKDFSKTP
ncbi:nuclear factor related to kappa-B-binding protein-like [Acanthaster planci]|uniref:Nuclear factor related to kappa-B-binding protein-like n=1 Tax=Acanthaster planci TaxID=133434 RepID=A0A8B7Z548_ACAPL|nr:nuclear factor related to kappa-B-binding protein-like [Acanthaster planci]XP_022098461.1 nuclear factor related to kappa-B-binding protein-like [Acanthaster planci]XP_022098462.1 nuclear factor related to kappa-B-binding protein-like [Acanthaster planci]